MKLADKDTCTGCGACKAACRKGAIDFQKDENGFFVPVVDAGKCVDCNQCSQACHVLNPPDRNPVRAAYAAQTTDKELLMESTSGALFPVLAQAVLRNSGVVYGCVWDEKYNAVFSRAESEEQTVPMKGSKYVWSWAGDVLAQVKEDLENGREVHFAGLPCQVAGVKKFLRKDYDNLFLMDCLCNGAPSPMAFRKYLETIVPEEKLSELNLKFRDKSKYGVGVHITYNGLKKQRKGDYIRNPYYYAFYKHMLDRESCYQCSYGTDQRISDITVGDYWGVDPYHKEMDIKGGVSALLVNTEKGEKLVARMKDQLALVETKKEYISKANNLLLNGKSRKRTVPEIREKFFPELRENGWKAAEKKYLHSFSRFRQSMKFYAPGFVVDLARKMKKSK